MARIRSLKPEFWTDSRVVGLKNPWSRLFFMGMWNFALCDAGHLDDDALALKLRILPAEAVDADQLLADVLETRMVVRDQTPKGRSYLRIPRLADHSKVDTRWSPRCPYCKEISSANLTETPASSGEPPGSSAEPADTQPNSAQEGIPRRGSQGEEKNISSESADADPHDDHDDPPPDEPREDVEHLCRLLVELMVANGSRKPYVTKKWRDAARLLIDRDHVDPLLAEHVLRWSQQNEFWRANIQSMPTFREKFDRLRLQRKREHDEAQRAGPSPGQRIRPAQGNDDHWNSGGSFGMPA